MPECAGAGSANNLPGLGLVGDARRRACGTPVTTSKVAFRRNGVAGGRSRRSAATVDQEPVQAAIVEAVVVGESPESAG